MNKLLIDKEVKVLKVAESYPVTSDKFLAFSDLRAKLLHMRFTLEFRIKSWGFILLKVLIFIYLVFCNFSIYANEPIKIVAFGTSFTNGRGVFRSQAYPAKIEEKLRANGVNVTVLNLGVNGDTTFDLIARMGTIPSDISIVIYEFGRGNDSMKGISEDGTFINSEKIIQRLLKENHRVLILIRNKDLDKLSDLKAKYSDLAKLSGVELLSIHQPNNKVIDRGHPTVEAHNEIAEQMIPPLEKLLGKTK